MCILGPSKTNGSATPLFLWMLQKYRWNTASLNQAIENMSYILD